MFFKRSTSGDLFYKNDVRKGKTTKRDVWRPKLQFRTSNLCILATSLLLTVRGGEIWTDPQGGYPSGCRLINRGIRT
jgi:hypothetical protein